MILWSLGALSVSWLPLATTRVGLMTDYGYKDTKTSQPSSSELTYILDQMCNKLFRLWCCLLAVVVLELAPSNCHSWVSVPRVYSVISIYCRDTCGNFGQSGSITGNGTDFSLPRRVQTGSAVTQPLSSGGQVLFLRCKAAGARRWPLPSI
jgi:hypothetical protein